MSVQQEHGYICLRDLAKSFQEGNQRREVLAGASACIRRGEFIAILGRSGSGKSTLLNLISGIDSIDSGAVFLDGREISALNERERTLFRRQHIGFIFQFFNLLPTLTVLENAMLPLELNATNARQAEAKARLRIDEVGLAGREGAFPDRLSGGEQQRVAIARALVHDPTLLLADEPTGNLDETTGRHIMTLLDRLTRQSGKNLILVTHSRNAASYADRILQLQGGKLLPHVPE
jgi:putative ABC transport system ATP-binding protein